jgi:type VII secretion-associated serine protease mycosin
VSRIPRRRRLRAAGSLLGALACVAASALFTAGPAHADTIRDDEWPVGFLDLPAAQQLSTGAGVTVALLDTGVVQGRADLTGQVTTGPDYAGGIEQPGQSGWGEHGTCMASIIAGHGRDGGADGMLGVAPAAHILSIRVIRDDDAPDADAPTKDPTPITDGIDYAVDHGAQVISMSLGGEDSASEADAIRYALAHNVVVVAAAGNAAQQNNAVSYPGADRGVLTVAAVDEAGRHAGFSTTGWDVAVAAPGVNVPCDAPDSDDSFMLGDGTSQATAYVSGLVALIKAENPAITPEQVRSVLEQTATDKPADGRDDETGFGVIDPVAALRAARGLGGLPVVPTPGPSVPGGHFGYGATQQVTVGSAGLSRRSRAEIGGAVLLLIALAVAAGLLRRPRAPSADPAAWDPAAYQAWDQAPYPPWGAQGVLGPPGPRPPPDPPKSGPGLGSDG